MMDLREEDPRDSTGGAVYCNRRTCNHNKGVMGHCSEMICANYIEKCDLHSLTPPAYLYD